MYSFSLTPGIYCQLKDELLFLQKRGKGTPYFFSPPFVILSQIPKQTFELDKLSPVPHLWYFFVYIVDNFVYNCVFCGLFPFFSGDKSVFFHNLRFRKMLHCSFFCLLFVKFAQKANCQ